MTSHAAFHYLAERYGLEQLAITGLSPESEPDPARLDELADLIERDGITTVFYESLVSPDVAETLARETGVQTAVLNPIEGLTEDQIDAGADYASVQRENLVALATRARVPGGMSTTGPAVAVDDVVFGYGSSPVIDGLSLPRVRRRAGRDRRRQRGRQVDAAAPRARPVPTAGRCACDCSARRRSGCRGEAGSATCPSGA